MGIAKFDGKQQVLWWFCMIHINHHWTLRPNAQCFKFSLLSYITKAFGTFYAITQLYKCISHEINAFDPEKYQHLQNVYDDLSMWHDFYMIYHWKTKPFTTHAQNFLSLVRRLGDIDPFFMKIDDIELSVPADTWKCCKIANNIPLITKVGWCTIMYRWNRKWNIKVILMQKTKTFHENFLHSYQLQFFGACHSGTEQISLLAFQIHGQPLWWMNCLKHSISIEWRKQNCVNKILAKRCISL